MLASAGSAAALRAQSALREAPLLGQPGRSATQPPVLSLQLADHMAHSPRLSLGPRGACSLLAQWERDLPGEQVLPGVCVRRLPGAHPVVK